MQRVMFATELEALHMSTSVSAFQGCSKEGLVKGLWRNHSNEPRVSGQTCWYQEHRAPASLNSTCGMV